MKNIPIVILNRDRLVPMVHLVESLHKKNYTNIIIIDNQTTYEPTLEWYKNSGVEVFYNNIPETLYDTGTLHRLAVDVKHPRFVDLLKDYYVFTDSDVVPVDEIPDNFLEHMFELCEEFKGIHKIGLGVKIDDLLEDNPQTPQFLNYEKDFWSDNRRIPHPKYELYKAPIDTGFALYTPNSAAGWSDNSIRMAGDYMMRHYPFYYYLDRLPDDEFYYLKHLPGGRGPVVSWHNKNLLISKGDI